MGHDFEINPEFKPLGDQQQAIAKIADGVQAGLKYQTLLGVTGSGKTFTMAGVIEATQRPTLVIAHNKTLVAQLATEFKEFFPKNAVEYFVSFYDYYQPESYIPKTDTYIEKDSAINAEINRLRLSTTNSLMTRRDTIVVASVSSIYGLGEPDEYRRALFTVKVGDEVGLRTTITRLVAMHYERHMNDCLPGQFRVKGDMLEVMPSYSETILRIQFFGDEVESISEIDTVTSDTLQEHTEIGISPAKHFIVPDEKVMAGLRDIATELDERLKMFEGSGRLLEAQRLRERTNHDIEMIREVGTCNGVENYSRPLSQRPPGSPPWTLLDYFPDDYLVFIDESHITLPQVRAMYHGDRARKSTLIEYGFRLPSALDNRPLSFNEFDDRAKQILFVSATPGPYESEVEQRRAEQIVRPTGITDPEIEIVPTKGQIDDLMDRVQAVTSQGRRVLVTTLTKRMAERLTEYLIEYGIKVQYIHSEVDTLDRVQILRDLRLGVYDVLVGINLLREGLDLPEVSLVAILDADKEGYLRSETSLIQTIGRAARHAEGSVVLYADRVTGSMQRALDETERRRKIQAEYNTEHGITPKSIVKKIADITDRVKRMEGEQAEAELADKEYDLGRLTPKESAELIRDLEKQMRRAAKDLDFERAVMLRDRIKELRQLMKAIKAS